MRQIYTTFVFILWGGLNSCTNNTHEGAAENNAAIAVHNATTSQMEGIWQYKDINFDIELNIPGMQDQFKTMLEKELKKKLDGAAIYYPDGEHMMYVHKNDTVRSKYKLENNELVHYDFGTNEHIMSYANAHIDGNTLKVSISEEQFYKMLQTAETNTKIPDEVKKMFKVNSLTYTFEKK